MRYRGFFGFVGLAGACSAAPSFVVGSAEMQVDASRDTDSMLTPSIDAELFGDVNIVDSNVHDASMTLDARSDSTLLDALTEDASEAGPDVFNAGPYVDPPMPERDALLADPACIFAFQGPLDDGTLRPPITEMFTDARCGGRPIRFFRPGSEANWGGFDLTYASLKPGSSHHLGIRTMVPVSIFQQVAAVQVYLVGDSAATTVKHPSWSIYAVMRVEEVPSSVMRHQFAFVAYDPVAPSGSMAINNRADGLVLQVASSSLKLSALGVDTVNQPLLYGIRYDQARGLKLEVRKRTPAGVVRSEFRAASVASDPDFYLPPMPARNFTLLGSGSAARTLQGELAEFTLVGRALSDAENAKLLDELVLVHGL
jgi:hypothetical protein